MGFGGAAQGIEQRVRGDAIGQRQLAAGEHQHVADLMFQFVQAFLEATGEPLLGLYR